MAQNILEKAVFELKVNDSLYLKYDVRMYEPFYSCELYIKDEDKVNIKVTKERVYLGQEEGSGSKYCDNIQFLKIGTYNVEVVYPGKKSYATGEIFYPEERCMKTITVI